MAHYLVADYYVVSAQYIIEADSEEEALEIAQSTTTVDPEGTPDFDRSEVLEPLDAARLTHLSNFYEVIAKARGPVA